tara:strand:- start:67 stop:453 length:387 start_codon:yes stop_codon:yes gene_type:complete
LFWSSISIGTGTYEALVAGQENEALADITGGLPQDYKLRGSDAISGLDAECLWNELCAHSDADETNLVCASTHTAGNGIMSGHAYGVVNLKTIQTSNSEEDMVQIRNPWGKVCMFPFFFGFWLLTFDF